MQLESILIQNQVFASEDVLKRDLSEAVQKKCCSLQSGTFVGTFFYESAVGGEPLSFDLNVADKLLPWRFLRLSHYKVSS